MSISFQPAIARAREQWRKILADDAIANTEECGNMAKLPRHLRPSRELR